VTCAAFLARTPAYFAAHRSYQGERLMTGNAVA
jgi:hypothetical protein